jgi:hypothetical protein
MIINELIQILNNKLQNLFERKNSAYVNGDISLYEEINTEIQEVQEERKERKERH